MVTREIIRIDEERCDGCGLCVSACAEGAIAVVDGKARLVRERLCDGLGFCLGHCLKGAITTQRVEAEPFDEIVALRHLVAPVAATTAFASCPGSREVSFEAPAPAPGRRDGPRPSALRQWPVQLHLVSPAAPHFRGADLLLAADCVAYAMGDFHKEHLAGRALAIARPKLNAHQEIYLASLVALIDDAGIASLTVMVMEVPCCSGLIRLAQAAVKKASRRLSVRAVVINIRGDVLHELGSSGARLSGPLRVGPIAG